MTIDIVNLNSSKYSDLNAVQLAMVRAAQAKKNKILAEAKEEKAKIFQMLLSNGFARSTLVTTENARIDGEAQTQISVVKEDLDYQLAYEGLASEGNDQGPYRYPQNPNYNLSYSQRFLVVRTYYMNATNDPNARLQAYSMDTLAREYLGEFYQTLYELLASYC